MNPKISEISTEYGLVLLFFLLKSSLSVENTTISNFEIVTNLKTSVHKEALFFQRPVIILLAVVSNAIISEFFLKIF
jgi:hypothetical protein